MKDKIISIGSHEVKLTGRTDRHRGLTWYEGIIQNEPNVGEYVWVDSITVTKTN